MEGRDRFWQRWLVVATIGVAVCGLLLVVAPAFGRRVFGLLIYSAPS